MKLEIELTEHQLELLKYSIRVAKTNILEELDDAKYEKKRSKDEMEIEQLNTYIFELEYDLTDLEIILDNF